MEAEERATTTKIRRIRDKESEECQKKSIEDTNKDSNVPKSTEEEAVDWSADPRTLPSPAVQIATPTLVQLERAYVHHLRLVLLINKN